MIGILYIIIEFIKSMKFLVSTYYYNIGTIGTCNNNDIYF